MEVAAQAASPPLAIAPQSRPLHRPTTFLPLAPHHQNPHSSYPDFGKCKRKHGRSSSFARSSGSATFEKQCNKRDDGRLASSKMYLSRRGILYIPATSLLAFIVIEALESDSIMAAEFADMPALRGKDYGKSKMRYPDYTETSSGLQYKDLRLGTGPTPTKGETVVVDWDGYTIGYYGRIFEARNKAKGGSFEGNEKDYFRFKIGSQEVIPAFEEAIATMSVGGVRRIIVPPNIGYPDNDFNKKGPRPTTFSGQRALDFVLKNEGLIDKTLLFDIELLKVSPT